MKPVPTPMVIPIGLVCIAAGIGLLCGGWGLIAIGAVFFAAGVIRVGQLS